MNLGEEIVFHQISSLKYGKFEIIHIKSHMLGMKNCYVVDWGPDVFELYLSYSYLAFFSNCLLFWAFGCFLDVLHSFLAFQWLFSDIILETS